MMIYDKRDKPNLTLDYFERGLISQRFSSIIERINRRRAKKYSGLLSRGNGMQTLYTFDNPKIINVILFLSDQLNAYRSINHQEKVFSSHVNIFRPELRSRFNIITSKYVKFQTRRPVLHYKRMNLPLGKIRVLEFKRKGFGKYYDI